MLHWLCFMQTYWDISKSVKMKWKRKELPGCFTHFPFCFHCEKGCIVWKGKSQAVQRTNALNCSGELCYFSNWSSKSWACSLYVSEDCKKKSRQRTGFRLVGVLAGENRESLNHIWKMRHHFLEPLDVEWGITILCLNITNRASSLIFSHQKERKPFLNFLLDVDKYLQFRSYQQMCKLFSWKLCDHLITTSAHSVLWQGK